MKKLNLRIDNLELRNAKSLLDVKYYEFVKWYPNEFYNKYDDFEWDENRQMYRSKKLNYFYCTEESFKKPESCYTISTVEISEDYDEPDIRSVGSRTADLTDHEWLIYRKLIKYFWDNYDFGRES